MLPSLASAAILAFLSPAQEATVEQARPPVITHPTWARAPNLRAPDGQSRSALVRVDCGLGQDGALTGCQITDIVPEDDAAGQIALRALNQARLDPRTVDRAPANIRVRFPLQIWMGR